MPDIPSPSVAARLSGALLAPLGSRWMHTKAVAARAESLAVAVPESERQLVVVAAWWHDLGYAPGLVDTGMHQIDGAQFVNDMAYPDRLAALVAHHSAAECEARQRGLLSQLQRWPKEESPVADVLWMADMTTGPGGESLQYADRLAEILSRYGEESTIGRAMLAAKPLVLGAIMRTTERLKAR